MATSGEFILPITGPSANNLKSSTDGYDDLLFSWKLSNSSTGEISWSVHLRAGENGRINSNQTKLLTVIIDGETVFSNNVYVGINKNTARPLCDGSKKVGFKSFVVSLQINLSGIIWHKGQPDAFDLGFVSGSTLFTTTGATTTDKSTPPSINVGNIIRDEEPVTFENTIYINNTGTKKDGQAAELNTQNSYISLFYNDTALVTVYYKSFRINDNMTTSFQSLMPNTPYSVKIHIENDGESGSNTFEYTSNVFYTKSIYPPSKPNNVNISYNTDEPESDSEYTLSWSNPTDLGYSGGTDISGTFNVLRFVIDDIYCNAEKLLSSSELSTFIWTTETTGLNHTSLRIKQDDDDLNFYWDDLDTPFYTKSNYSLPDDSTLWFSISAQRVYKDRFNTPPQPLNYSPSSLNDTLVTSNVVGPIQDQAKVFVLVNGQWKQGKVFVNINNSWKKAKSVFSKVNNQWLKQKNE